MSDEKLQRGFKKLRELGSKSPAEDLKIFDFVPGFGQALVEYEFCDIYNRPGLDLKARQMVTIAGLTALGYAVNQLHVHVRMALKAGCTKLEIYETMIQMAPFAGFPAVINALKAAKEVIEALEKAS